MKKIISLFLTLAMLLGCIMIVPTAAEPAQDDLTVQAYLLKGDTNYLYLVFSEKITDYENLKLFQRISSPEVSATLATDVTLENEYTLKYTVSAYFVGWQIANQGGTFHLVGSLVAGNKTLAMKDMVGLRGDPGTTGLTWTETAYSCYNISYEVVTSVDDIPVPPNEGTGNEGTGNEGTGNEGTGNEGTGNEGTGNEGTGNEGTGNEGTGNEGTGNEGTGNEGTTTAELKAKAYTITGNTNTVYVVFSHKVTDAALLWVSDFNGITYCGSSEAVGTDGVVYKYTSNIGQGLAEIGDFARGNGTLFFRATNPLAVENAEVKMNASYKLYGDQPEEAVFVVDCEDVASVDDVPTSYPEDTGNEGTGNEGTGNEGTGNEGTGNEGTGNEGTGNEGTGNEGTGNEGTGNEGTGNENNNTPVVKPLAGKVYTVKGEPTKLYLVFNQKLSKAEASSIVLAPAGILATDMTVVDDHIICFNQTSEWPLAILLKSGYNGTPQQCYMWGDNLVGQNGATLPKEDKVTVWGSEASLYLFEYAGEVDSITELPAAAATGDNTVIAGVVVIAACALTLGLVAKKRKED